MTAIYASLSLHETHHLKNLLQSAGIRCRIRNESLSTLAGEIPFPECAMQIELEDDADLARAGDILREFRSRAPASAGSWTCTRCGEHSEPQFTACWNCGAERI